LRTVTRVSLLLMTVLTVIYAVAVGYANTNATYSSGFPEGTHPTDYGIWKHYMAEKVATEPDEWYTAEELGVFLVEDEAAEGLFHILIEDEAKALPWMRDEEFMPRALKYEGEFYAITSLWVLPGLPERVRQWQLPMGRVLGAAWIVTGASLLHRRKGECEI
jgi:hypothetical protein